MLLLPVSLLCILCLSAKSILTFWIENLPASVKFKQPFALSLILQVCLVNKLDIRCASYTLIYHLAPFGATIHFTWNIIIFFQVFNTYGSMGNAALLHRYGFTEPDNPLDIINIDLDLVIKWCSSSFSNRYARSRLSCFSKPCIPLLDFNRFLRWKLVMACSIWSSMDYTEFIPRTVKLDPTREINPTWLRLTWIYTDWSWHGAWRVESLSYIIFLLSTWFFVWIILKIEL